MFLVTSYPIVKMIDHINYLTFKINKLLMTTSNNYNCVYYYYYYFYITNNCYNDL